jgi:hypothetical protein
MRDATAIPASAPEKKAERKRIPCVSEDKPGVCAGQHHAFNADVEDPRFFRDLLAKAGQQQRHARRDGAEDQRAKKNLGKKRIHSEALMRRR